ncbi:Mob1/phocein family protein [Histomonas meleagridis]|uniref:Mob1/phocein family protein n=1 Tax=Histomonas meleagridis TaxID=135588 RepID=UPI00355945FD|nr:Mob1/phocein family protein [Histomonas meleagridis]KAH0804378.1 Mob1/phocein family protein [Histomonas meleagridis]
MPGRRRSLKVKTVMFSKDVVILAKKYSQLEKVTGVTLNSDFQSMIQIPKTHTLSDWLIVNAIDFFERVELLYSSCSLFCTVDTCPMFNAGPHYHYFWEDADTPQPVQLSAPEYFNSLKRYIKRNFSNPKLFPKESGAKLSEEAMEILRTTYRRLFRILAHLYMCHFSYILKFKFENVINTIFGHYATFALQYDMISPQDLEMLRPVLAAMNIQLPAEEKPQPQ